MDSPKCSSICTIKHQWTISNFSNLFRDDSASFIYSETFPPKNYDFKFSLRLLPRYSDDDDKQNSFVSIYLYLEECKLPNLNSYCRFSIIYGHNKIELNIKEETANFAHENCRGFSTFVLEKTVHNLLRLFGDSLIILCQIEIDNHKVAPLLIEKPFSCSTSNVTKSVIKLLYRWMVQDFSAFYYDNLDQCQPVYLRMDHIEQQEKNDYALKFYAILKMSQDNPDKNEKKCGKYISVFVHFESDVVNIVMINFRLALLDWKSKFHVIAEGHGNLISNGDGKGPKYFITCDELVDLKKGLLPKDKLTIFAQIEVMEIKDFSGRKTAIRQPTTNIIKRNIFSDNKNEDLSKYKNYHNHLIEIEGFSYLFCDLIQEQLEFHDKKQKEIDITAIEVEQDILGGKMVKLNLVNGDDCLRLIQSVIEVMGKVDCDKVDLLANWIDLFIKESSQKLLHFHDLVCQVIYPYFSLNLTIDTFTKHRNVCLVISALITTMKDFKLRVNLYKIVITYLTQIVMKCGEIENEWMFMFAIIGLGNLDLTKEDIETLAANRKFCKILEAQNYSSYDNCLDYYNIPKQILFQSNLCARWFYDKIFGNKITQQLSTNKTKLDINSATCHLKLSPNCLSARSDWAWQSVRSTRAVSGSTFYFEVTLHTNGPIRIGWSTKRTDLKALDMLVGSDEHSIAFDGYHRLIWHENKSYPVKSVPQWIVGDVVGCLIGNNQFNFYLNQQHIPTPSLVYFSSKAYFASVSLSSHQQCTFNFIQSKLPQRRTSFLYFDSLRSARKSSFIKTKNSINDGNIGTSIVLNATKLIAPNVFMKSITAQQQGSGSTSKETSTKDTNSTEESEDEKFLEDGT